MTGHIFEISPTGGSSSHADDDPMDIAFSKRGFCFRIPFGSSSGGPSSSSTVSPWWRRIGGGAADSAKAYNEPWWRRGWKKVREWSEKVAGPKWKTFIRRFRRNWANNRYAGLGARAGGGQFHYDPQSYAMNFDEGHGDDLDDGDSIQRGRGFSSRYASIPASSKGSMDLGRDGGPHFT